MFFPLRVKSSGTLIDVLLRGGNGGLRHKNSPIQWKPKTILPGSMPLPKILNSGIPQMRSFSLAVPWTPLHNRYPPIWTLLPRRFFSMVTQPML